jgi:hypothetical protein
MQREAVTVSTDEEAADGMPVPPKLYDRLIDTRTGRLGHVVRVLDDYLRLRPLRGGGHEWDAPRTAVRLATDDERRAAVRRTRGVRDWRGVAR